MKAAGYTRLSQDSDTSIDRQKEEIKEYCRKQDLELREIFDDGERTSGYNIEREQYQRLKEKLQEIDTVVARDRQRLGRDFDERMQFILDLRQTDTALHITTEGEIDLSDPYSVVMESMQSASDDKSKRKEIEKAKKEVQKRQEKGYYQGKPPFGLQFDDEKKYLVPDENFETALKVLKLRDQDKSYPDISDELGITTSKAYRINQNRDLYHEKTES
jgi:DNA invertase Pin-like site-specific DNA recombinase